MAGASNTDSIGQQGNDVRIAVLEDLKEFFERRKIDIGTAQGGPAMPKLVTDRVLDSIMLLELIAMIERHLGRDLRDNELANANFDSMEAIVAMMTEGHCPAS